MKCACGEAADIWEGKAKERAGFSQTDVRK
jgi:hypothetical protein